MYLLIDRETTGLPVDYNSLSSYQKVKLIQIDLILMISNNLQYD
jgi:hypothetical protein